MPWDPDKYNEFRAARAAPFTDLLALITLRDGMKVIDLGCGTGDLTRQLADALPNSDVLGIDSSLSMLAKASAYERPGLRFACQHIEEVDGQWDLVFSHAAIQWIPEHRRLIPHLLALVKQGGQLAVQLPSNGSHVSHWAMHETATEEPFYTALQGWQLQLANLPIEQYGELLFRHGGQHITVFEKVYATVLDNVDHMADWMMGTALVPYFERLPEVLHAPFLARYRQKLRAYVPDEEKIYFPFRRTLLCATRGA